MVTFQRADKQAARLPRRYRNLIAQEIAAGQGLAVLDPHGDLGESALLHVPRNRDNVMMRASAPVTRRSG